MLSFEGNDQGPPSPRLRRDGCRSRRADGAGGQGAECAGRPQTPPPRSRPRQAEPTPTFRTDINFVRVDVIVTDKQGNPVHDLRQEDFEVTEDGKPQSIQTFKLVNVTENAGVGSDPPREVRNVIEEQTEAARDDVRLFAVFLDDYHVRLENSMRAREPIARFIEEPLQAADMAGIMYPLWSINDVMLTRNRKDVAGAIRGVPGPQVRLHAAERFRRTLRALRVDDGGGADPEPGHALGAEGADHRALAGCAKGARRSSSSAKDSRIRCRRRCSDPIAALHGGSGGNAAAAPDPIGGAIRPRSSPASSRRSSSCRPTCCRTSAA